MALVWGDFEEDRGTITGNIGRSTRDRKVFAVFPDGSHGRHAVTHYTVMERFGYVTLIDCKLETGRTHQIRVHFQHIRHPLFGDETYGGNVILKGTTFTKYKQFVNNSSISFPVRPFMPGRWHLHIPQQNNGFSSSRNRLTIWQRL